MCRWTSRAWPGSARGSVPPPCRSSPTRTARSTPRTGGSSSTTTSPAASAPRAGRATTGWRRCCTGSCPARAPTRTSTPCWTPATTCSAGRSARSATVRPARCSPRSSTSSRTTWTTSRAGHRRCCPRPTTWWERTDVTDVAKRSDAVTLTIDGVEVEATKGELVIRVAERLGIAIPRFCDHPLLAPAGACRQCLVDIEGQRKPAASCTQPVSDGMVVRTQRTSEGARRAQEGIMEFLLINHPLDCPRCDKGGECPLQNQAMSTGRTDTRFHDVKRTYEKPINISSQVLLDRERCVLCQRCTRFSDEIAGDKFIDLMDRSAAEQINIYPGDPFQSYFSGNTVQICPVGALTGAQYRFRSRPFDLVSTPSACEHCAAGCAQRTDWRRGNVPRRLAREDPEAHDERDFGNGRWGLQYSPATPPIPTPL